MRVFIYEAICADALGDNVPPSLLREGQAMLSAVAEDFQRIRDVEVITVEKGSRRLFDDLAATCDWTLVIAPEFDDLLHALSQRVLGAGGRLLGSAPNAIRLTGDKLATAKHWQTLGVPHPRTTLLDAACDLALPGVIKPRHGAGSQATFLIRDSSDMDRTIRDARSEWQGDLITQPFVAGTSASVALLIAPTQTIPLQAARQRLSTDGRFRYQGGTLPLPEPWASRAVHLAVQAVASIDGLRGYAGVDLVVGEAGDFAIEINPRLTTSYIGLRQLCRQNLAELMLCCAQSESIEPPAWRDGSIDFQVDTL